MGNNNNWKSASSSLRNNTNSNAGSFKSASSFRGIVPNIPTRPIRTAVSRWLRSKRNLVRTVKNNDSVQVRLPFSKKETEMIRAVFKFTSKQMAQASLNLLEVKNKSQNAKHRTMLERFIKTIASITIGIDNQYRTWAREMESIKPRTILLPNYPVTPISSYAKSNTLRYQQNITMRALSPKVRVMLDQIGMRFAVIRGEMQEIRTKTFLRNAASANSLNKLGIIKNAARRAGVNNAIVQSVGTMQGKRIATSRQTPAQASLVQSAFKRTNYLRKLLPKRRIPWLMA